MKPALGFSDRTPPKVTDPCSPQTAELVERTRITVAGVLAPSLLHEFSNLLTIVDGSRQMARLGLGQPDSAAIDPTADRCFQLVVAFRHLLSAPPYVGAPVSLKVDFSGIRSLVEARLKGSPTQVRVDDCDPSISLLDTISTPLRLGWFAVILGEIERLAALGTPPAEIELSAKTLSDGGIGLSARYRVAGRLQRAHGGSYVASAELSSAAAELLASIGATLHWDELSDESREARLSLDATLPR